MVYVGSQLEGILQSIREEKAWWQKSEAVGHIAPRAEKQKDNRVRGGQGMNPHCGPSHWWSSEEDVSFKPLKKLTGKKKKVERLLEFGY